MYIKSNRRSVIIQILKREISLTDLAEHQLVKYNGMYNSIQLNKDWCKWPQRSPQMCPYTISLAHMKDQDKRPNCHCHRFVMFFFFKNHSAQE